VGIIHSFGSDDYLTPPQIIKALGPFDLDPACPPNMPWKTAKKMLTKEDDGLLDKWWKYKARVWNNPPYSRVWPWAQRLAWHVDVNGGSGHFLVTSKSTGTRSGQLMLRTADSAFFVGGRWQFYLPSGEITEGKWVDSVLYNLTPFDTVKCIKAIDSEVLSGVLMRRLL